MKHCIGLTLTALAAALVLAGCGGGGGSSPSVSVVVSPATATVATGGQQVFSAAVTGTTNTQVTWQVQGGPANGTIDTSGLYTAPAHPVSPVTILAFSAAVPTSFGQATVTVVASGVTVAIAPQAVALMPGQQQQFTATVAGTSNAGVNFSIPAGDTGTITSTGLYTAPTTLGVHHVVVTSQADPNQSATATITIGSISVIPNPVTLGPGGQVQFTATVMGAATNAVTYSIQEGSAGGTISPAGLYVAPLSVGSGGATFHVVVTSTSIPGLSTIVPVTVTQATGIGVTVTPTAVTLNPGMTQQFTAAVTGTTNSAVIWNASGGSITSTGLFTAPPAAGTYTITAASVLDQTKVGTATVTVPPIAVTLTVTPSSAVTSTSPLTAAVGPGQQLMIQAMVSGTTNQAVTYSVNPGGAGGTITAAGVYTAPQNTGTDVVTVTSTAFPTQSATLTILVQSGSGTVIVQ